MFERVAVPMAQPGDWSGCLLGRILDDLEPGMLEYMATNRGTTQIIRLITSITDHEQVAAAEAAALPAA